MCPHRTLFAVLHDHLPTPNLKAVQRWSLSCPPRCQQCPPCCFRGSRQHFCGYSQAPNFGLTTLLVQRRAAMRSARLNQGQTQALRLAYLSLTLLCIEKEETKKEIHSKRSTRVPCQQQGHLAASTWVNIGLLFEFVARTQGRKQAGSTMNNCDEYNVNVVPEKDISRRNVVTYPYSNRI